MTASPSHTWLPPVPHTIPTELGQGTRFTAWRGEIRKGEPKPAKMPCSPESPKGASSTNLTHWTPFDQAFKYAQVAMLDGLMRTYVAESIATPHDIARRAAAPPVRRTGGRQPTITAQRKTPLSQTFAGRGTTALQRLLTMLTDRVQGFNTPLPKKRAGRHGEVVL
jgi:hypothetical protein